MVMQETYTGTVQSVDIHATLAGSAEIILSIKDAKGENFCEYAVTTLVLINSLLKANKLTKASELVGKVVQFTDREGLWKSMV